MKTVISLQMLRVLWCIGFGLWLVGCATIESVPGADQVKLISAGQAVHCQRLGRASAQVVDKIAFVERDEQKMAEELLSLASNEAVSMGGNALLAVSEIKQGVQQFEIYLC